MRRSSLVVVSMVIVLATCAVFPFGPPTATPTVIPTLTPLPTLTAAATQSPSPSSTLRPTLTPSFTATFTAAPYQLYTVPFLRARSYGGGSLELTGKMDENQSFKRFSFRYPSDGLSIYGFMDVPQGAGPYPVIIMIHGGTPISGYSLLDYSTPYADELAGAGYLVLHPALRDYPPSDKGDNLYRVGMSIDVLNLIALVKAEGGQAGPLLKADPQRIGLWGHSVGGGVALKVITISSDVKAALLYASLSGDDKLNFEKFTSGSNSPEAQAEAQTNALAWFQISPQYFLADITAAVSIHQGLQDTIVPPAWSADTCRRLRALRKTVFCVNYPDMGHAFAGMTDKKFVALSVVFFDNYLKNTPP